MLLRVTVCSLVQCLVASSLAASEHYTVRLKGPRDYSSPLVEVMEFSPRGDELAIATDRGIQFVRTAAGNVTHTTRGAVFSIGYSKHGDLFYFLSSRQAKLLRVSDKSELPAKVNRIPGFIGINLEHRNGKLLVSRIDKGGPAERSGALQLGTELVAVGQGTGGKFKNVAGMRLERAIDALKGPFGTVVRLKVIPPGSIDEKIVTLRRAHRTVTAGERHFQNFEPLMLKDNVVWCRADGLHEFRDASSGNVVSSLTVETVQDKRGSHAISRDSRFYAWVGRYWEVPEVARKLRQQSVPPRTKADAGGGDGAAVAGAVDDDNAFNQGSRRDFYGAEVYDIGARKKVAMFPIAIDPVVGGGAVFRGINFSSNAKQLIVGTQTRLHVYDIETGTRTDVIEVKREPNLKSHAAATVNSTAVAGELAAVGGYVGTVRLLNWKSGKQLKSIDSKNLQTVSHVTLSTDGHKLAFHIKGVVHLVHLDNEQK